MGSTAGAPEGRIPVCPSADAINQHRSFQQAADRGLRLPRTSLQDEIRDAVRCIEDWQRAQAAAVKSGGPGQNAHGPLLQRVGGPDVVKKVVELFYKKLYADQRLLLFLHDQDVLHLRAKQSAFISWLFGPPNVPYLGRSVRIAHLRIIKQRGFSPDDFDMGMKYFEEAMAELGAPETIIGEVMRRLRPFKDAFFTPCARDADEEARWAVEERERAEAEEEATRQRQLAEEQEQQVIARERRLQEQITLAHRAAEVELAEADGESAAEWVADAAVMAAVAASLSASRAATRPPSRSAPQCPFTSGRRSRPASAAGPPAVSASGVAAASPAPRTPPTPPAAAGPAALAAGPPSPTAASSAASRVASPRPVELTAAADSVAGGTTPPRSPSGTGAGVASSRPASQLATRPGTGTSTRPTSGGAGKPAAAAATAMAAPAAAATEPMRVPSPTARSPSTPPAATDRPVTATEASPPAPPATAAEPAPTAVVVPEPVDEFEAELDAIERAYSPDSDKGGGESAPLLPPALESSSSGTRRTTAVPVC